MYHLNIIFMSTYNNLVKVIIIILHLHREETEANKT